MPKKSAKQRRKAKKAKQIQQEEKADAEATPEKLKELGVAAFRSGNPKRASLLFTRAIEALGDATKPNNKKEENILFKSQLLANRSAAFIEIRRFEFALRDANGCIKFRPNWGKAYLRKAIACEQLCLYLDALEAFQLAEEKDASLSSTASRGRERLRTVVCELDLCTNLVAHNNLQTSESRGQSSSDRVSLSPTASRGSVQKHQKFFSWMEQNGAMIGPIYLNLTTEGGRGIHARRNLEEGDVLLYVPEKLLLTTKMAKSAPLGMKIQNSGYKVRTEQSYVAIFILDEIYKIKSGKSSFWKPYLDVLLQVEGNIKNEKYVNGKEISTGSKAPSPFSVLSTMPIFYTPYHLELLKGSVVRETLRFRAEAIREEFTNLCMRVPEVRKFTLQEFMWARCCVLSRILGLRKKATGEKFSALVPLLDMTNHSRPSSAQYGYSEESADSKGDSKRTRNESTKLNPDGAGQIELQKGVILAANQPLERGGQIRVSYGRKGNNRYFVNYGFTLDHNPDDEGVLVFSMRENEPHYPEKCTILRQKQIKTNALGWINREFQMPSNPRDIKFTRMMSFLRLIKSEGDDFIFFQTNLDRYDIEMIGPVSIENEIKVLRAVQISAEKGLSAFPESVAHDHKLLKANKWIDLAHKNCIAVRCSEKQVLSWFLNLAKEGISILKLNWLAKKGSEEYTSNLARLKDIKDAALANYILTIRPLLQNPGQQ